MKKTKYPEHAEKYLESVNEISKKPSFIQKMFVAPDVILKMLIGKDKKCNEILEKSGKGFKLITSDFALYEAISCITKEEFNLNSLIDFLYKVEIVPSSKIKIDMDRIDHLREVLKK